MAKFKVGDIVVCIESCTGISGVYNVRVHNNPPKKDEEFPVLDVNHFGAIALGGVGDGIGAGLCYWVSSKFKHKTNDLFESQIDAIEKSLSVGVEESIEQNK